MTTIRRIGRNGRALIRSFESLALTAYLCPAGVWTIGYGSTGAHVKSGLTITAARAEELLTEDLDRFERCLTVQVPTATQNQYDAMMSLAFNIGTTNFTASTLLRKHRAANTVGAAAEFARWNKSKGKVLAGLTRRRAAEAALYAL